MRNGLVGCLVVLLILGRFMFGVLAIDLVGFVFCVCLVDVSLCLCLLGGFDFGFFYDFVLWVTECG